MKVKGNGWLARCEVMEKTVGPEKWAEFLKARASRFAFLQTPVMPISRIEVREFLALHDELVEHFFGGDKQAYWRFGEQSGEWALQHQLRGLFSPGEGRRFLQFSPQIYKNYFDGGELLNEASASHMDLVIRGVEIPHVYFEYSIIGFAAAGLRMLEVNATPECIKGFSRGDDEVRYRFAVSR
ncbi:MAG: hypothetical protein DI536_23220 [Archangium gephyra]|uniref:Uncharacterized protein n=1 Tax=Archangium gephyra TaxID=48 RepID=A0A2W5T9L2_9BACT|nr:MAG: hypothetical protein DI536_23220 [Archangium gephyra]